MNAPSPKLTLSGRSARIEPLDVQHLEALRRTCSDTGVWQYLPVLPPSSSEDWGRWLMQAFSDREKGIAVPFAIIDTVSEMAVGSTRYLDIVPEHRSIEIGWTFVAPTFQRTAVNTEVKLLLLKHAFEVLGAERICIKTDGRNLRAQRAIERLGAKYEGTLRRHRVLPDGFVRDSVYYSLLLDEWPATKVALEQRLASIRPDRE